MYHKSEAGAADRGTRLNLPVLGTVERRWDTYQPFLKAVGVYHLEEDPDEVGYLMEEPRPSPSSAPPLRTRPPRTVWTTGAGAARRLNPVHGSARSRGSPPRPPPTRQRPGRPMPGLLRPRRAGWRRGCGSGVVRPGRFPEARARGATAVTALQPGRVRVSSDSVQRPPPFATWSTTPLAVTEGSPSGRTAPRHSTDYVTQHTVTRWTPTGVDTAWPWRARSTDRHRPPQPSCQEGSERA